MGHQYFNLTDDEISIDHEWDKAGVHICNTEFPLKDILRECLINGEYLYYHDDTSIYRVKLDGVFKIETIKSFDCPVQLFRMDGDWLYVSQRSSIFPIRKLKLDGSQYTIIKDNRLNNEALDNFYVKDGWIYMVLLKKIVKASNDGTIVQDLVVVPEDKEIWVDWAVGLYNGWIYYYINDGNEFMRYKVNIDGTENIQINKGEL